MSSIKKSDNNAANSSRVGLFSAVIRQCIAVFICIAFVLGMKFCPNPRMALWADSLGHALRQNTSWSITPDSVLSWFEDKMPAVFDLSGESTPKTPDSNTDEITFH